jgi:hypothetical protein
MNETNHDDICNGCMDCCPEDYTVEVDLHFLLMVEHALGYLRDQIPDYYAPGWMEDTLRYKDQLIKKYDEIDRDK